jgi:hypothetical protein
MGSQLFFTMLFLLQGRSKNGSQEGACERNFSTSFKGTILAGRYKVLGTIGNDAFKAHDLFLDQAVIGRAVSHTSGRERDRWHQNVKQLTSVRNINFLNIVDVISEPMIDFVLTERPSGRSIAELLAEKGGFDLEEVVTLLTPMARALETVAAFPSGYKPGSASNCLFAETRRCGPLDNGAAPQDPSYVMRLDFWQFVEPGNCSSATRRKGDLKFAVRQAALLAYQFLGGECEKNPDLQRNFKPVVGLQSAANKILYRGLTNAKGFKSTAHFFNELKRANRPSDCPSKRWTAPIRLFPEPPMVISGTNAVLAQFNCETRHVTTGLLAFLVFGLLTFTLLLPERALKPIQLAAIENRAKAYSLPEKVSAAPPAFVSFKEKAPVQALALRAPIATEANSSRSSHDPEKPPKTADEHSIPPSVLVLNSPVANLLSELGARSDLKPSIPGDKSEHYRPAKRVRQTSIQMRLLALWHQSLVKNEKPVGWTMLSHSHKGKRVAYSVGTQP